MKLYSFSLLLLALLFGGCRSEKGSIIKDYDQIAPDSPSLIINSSATSTLSATANMSLTSHDAEGVTGYYLSESPTPPVATAVEWIAVSSSTDLAGDYAFSLSATEGVKTVYAWFKDDIGNISDSDYDSILLTSTWTKQPGTTGDEAAKQIALDPSGNVYAVGHTSGSLDGNSNLGGFDIIVSKYNAAGILQWTKQPGTSADDFGQGIAVDSSGNIFVGGHTSGGLDGNTNQGGKDGFISKFNSTGALEWTKQIGTSVDDYVNALVLDPSGNIYVAGKTFGSLQGNTNQGSTDAFISKYDATGNLLWTKQPGTTAQDTAIDLTLDSSGNVYITGFVAGSLDGNTFQGGGSDVFFSKYNSSGVLQWTKQPGTTGTEAATAIATDSKGNIFIAGDTTGGLDGNVNQGGADIFVSKYDAYGVLQWTKQPGTTADEHGRGVSVDSTGNVYITGQTSGNLEGLTNQGGFDVFVSKYDTAGTHQLTKLIGSAGDEWGNRLKVDAHGNIYVASNTSGGVEGNTNQGGDDILVLKNPGGYLP